MAAEWYCQIDDKEYGPLTVDQLRSMARSGRLTSTGYVRRGEDGEWVVASRAKGLFDGITAPGANAPLKSKSGSRMDVEVAELVEEHDDPTAPALDERLTSIAFVTDCISREERKLRLSTMLVNVLIMIFLTVFVIASLGVMLIPVALIAILNWILSEYNVRTLQAYGTEATDRQLPEIMRELEAVCEQFDIHEIPKVIVLNAREINAFAIKFARKKVIVLLSETLEGILDKPQQLRFILGHEMGHMVLDHGTRGWFEIYKSAQYKAARELTCDNCGCAAAGNAASAKAVLKRLGVGNALHARLDERDLIEEANYIYSGLTGWLLKKYLTYPPLGRRIANINAFSSSV